MNLDFEELLSSKGGFYLVTSRERDIDIFLGGQPTDNSNLIKIIRGQRCKNKNSLFQEFAAALQYPYWFGPHWESFDDCITDLSWFNANKHFLFITNFDKVLADESSVLKVFFIMLKEAMIEWTQENKNRPVQHSAPFNVILHCESVNEEKCKALLEREKVHPLLRYLTPFDDIK